MSSPVRPAITPRGEEKIFFEHLKRQELVYQRCSDCTHAVFPLRLLCPSCGSELLELKLSAGRGTVYSFTTQHRPSHPYFADSVPYTLLLVDMAEGFRVFANLAEGTEADIPIGSPVEAVFDDSDEEWTLLRFRALTAGEEG